ncbi:uncharacterized protein N7496_008705 [Penicillium cataractarum]|uniref:Uncharacterized protein n=1 Tax=Penicillium cataractarum TaxID=2100454 RepID=A0A9W9RZ45_9EURO|nr:uncharacterized protein N7496_008705 [Penicillium cataractarum]KAJ5368945.1 hypothetical protein N7496_008705 [Penicillium cataractarum]
MGKLVKLLGSGVGLASEAIHAARSRSRSDQPSSSASASNTVPPEYVEVEDDTAERLIRSGQAERVIDTGDEKHPSKAAEAGYDSEGDSSESEELEALGQDEAAWELDEMAERVRLPTYDESEAAAAAAEPEDVKVKKEEAMVRELVRRAGTPPQPPQRIPCPVIIPQRRPRNKDRGFVRAYAPVLADCGISQEVFLQFLEDCDKASKASPWIEVVFVAAGIVGFVPEVSAQIVSAVVQVVAGTARELQSRSRRNTFLDRVNQDLLMPRGLYAMIMTFKDEIPGQQSGPLYRLSSSIGKTLFSSEKLDINQTVAKYSNSDPEMSKLKKGLKDIRLTSGQTRTQIELPEAAELIFPDLDRVAEEALEADGKGKETGTRDKFKNAGTWVQDYLDRRGQAFYEAEHQGSSLAVPSSDRKSMASRYNDPNHPANSGSLISLITGGAVNPAARRQARREAKHDRRAAKREYKDARRVARGRAPRGPRRVKRRGQRKTILKKILRQDVLYLLIVNLPSQEEVQQSVAQLEQVMSQTGAH